MRSWLKVRFDIFKLSLRSPVLLGIFGILQVVQLLLALVPRFSASAKLLKISILLPWYGWVIGWLVILWISLLEYSVKRKEEFDKTSLNFFKAFLDFLIQQGNHLFEDAGEKHFYSKLNDWQHQVIQGIAIGLGPGESEKYFQKMDRQSSMTKAYRQSQDSGSIEPLCRFLQDHLKELEAIRMSLKEAKDFEKADLEAVKNLKQIGEFKP